MRLYILLFFNLLFCSIVWSQQDVEFMQLSGDNLSTQSITYAIKQDSIGNVWIASEEGVLKHNSKNYRVYDTYNGLPETVSNRTRTLFIDSKQNIWIGLEKGVCIYNKDLDKFDLLGSRTDINPSLINTITEDKIGNIWIGAFNGLWKYDPKNPSLGFKRLLPNHNIQALYTIEDKIIIGTNKVFLLFDKSSGKAEAFVNLQNNINITSFGKYNNSILAGTNSGNVFKVDYKNKTLKPINVALSNPVRDILEDEYGYLYLAIDGQGIFQFNKDYKVLNHYIANVDNEQSITSDGVYDIELGKEGVIWIATYGGGVNYLDRNRLPFKKIQHKFNNKNSLVTNFTRAIAEDVNGKLWFGTKKGLSIWNPKTNQWKHIANLKDSNTNTKNIVLALEPDGDSMWVGTYNSGLYKLNINTYLSENYNKLIGEKLINKIYTLLKDTKGNLWVGGIQGDIGVIRKNGAFDTYPINHTKGLLESVSGEMYAVGRHGLYKINDTSKAFKLIEALKPDKNTLAYSTINAVHETVNKNLIIATNGSGLLFYNSKDETVKKLTVGDGLPSDIVQGILADTEDDFWISTTKGLVNVVIKSNDTILNIYDTNDGLASTEYNYGSFEKLSNNRFAFGGVTGVTLFNPNTINSKSDVPVIVFDEFKLLNKVMNPGKEILKTHINTTKNIVLKSKENAIEIKFTGVLHSSPSKIKYSWKLKGFNNDWTTPSTTNFATYTNLNPGKYTFKVKATNKYGSIGEERAINIEVLSPWWSTKKAYFLYLLIFGLLIYLIVHFTSVMVKKKNADEQINFFNNITHEIKTPLAILLSSLDNVTENVDANQDSKKRIKTTIKRINSLFEQMLNFHKVTSSNQLVQHVTKINVESHIKQIANDFKPLTKERNLTVNVTNEWDSPVFHFDVGIIDKIILNLLSNAIKYSFDDGKIEIKLLKTSLGELKIEIIDEGIGIPKEQQKYILKRYYRARNVINSQRPGTGLGLVMVKKLIEKTGGSINFISEENKGTTFIVLLKDLKQDYIKNEALKEAVLITTSNEVDEQLELDDYSDSKILIVEDNDELRAILVNNLGVYFQVFEAKDGKEGLEKAHQIFPDIILTDLIMPEMDGMQMSRALKADINLNHIPVFMLTVLQNSAQKLESIESGISEYIEKPVDIKYLLAKMTNTLKWQQKLRKKYVHESDSENASVFRDKNNQDFLDKLEKTVIEHIEDKSFSVHDLSGSFGMSRTSLYMKLKNLVDLSPQDFIIHTKLKFAKNLLIQGDSSIKEVAYSSGFSNPKYFSTSFKKFYGMTPSGFVESLQKK